MYTCAKCGARGCNKGDYSHALPNCPSQKEALQQQALSLYAEEENHLLAYSSALTNLNYRTRIEETMDFMDRCGYHRVGLAFCVGLWNEAHALTQILEYHGFEVISIICKTGSQPKAAIDIPDELTHSGDCQHEMMCNPIGQALLLNEQKVDFNLIVGLCVGHDTLAIKYLEAPVSVLAVKDRVTGHNPLAPIYTLQEYYKKTMFPPKTEEQKVTLSV